MAESAATHAFVEVCALDDLWAGEMDCFDVGSQEVLILNVDGQLHAYDGVCPHQSRPLIEGRFDGKTLVCRAHEWSFDACSGQGINPRSACLHRFPLRIVDGKVFVAVEASNE
jgi:nitrite reductase/ring-hydroxylating ferredoxin subunit